MNRDSISRLVSNGFRRGRLMRCGRFLTHHVSAGLLIADGGLASVGDQGAGRKVHHTASPSPKVSGLLTTLEKRQVEACTRFPVPRCLGGEFSILDQRKEMVGEVWRRTTRRNYNS